MNPLTTTPASTADAVLAQAGRGDALDALLRQIVNGYFVLTDAQGAVSKWSEPAELLFDQPSAEILGRNFFATLIGGALSPAGEAWRAFLDRADAPRVSGPVALVGRRGDGDAFGLEAVFVPVKLDEGFDFSLFLEGLAFELPLEPMVLYLRQQHPVVIHALKAALSSEVQPWTGRRTAGTLVVFRPLEPTPWIAAELARREAERALAAEETETRVALTDPGVQGDFRDLDDAAAVVERLLGAVERIDALELVTGDLPAQLAEARRDAEAVRAELSEVRQAAETGIASLRAELAAVREAAVVSDERRLALGKLETPGSALAGEAAGGARPAAEAGDGSSERVAEVFQQLLGLAATRSSPPPPPARREGASKPEPVARETRHGFDDLAEPTAILDLNGKFKELNPAFAKLVGYKEHEFAKAAWPSPHDRGDYKEQLEQLRRLRAGELRAVDVQSTYMHGQGLMVPVVGRLSLVTDADGRPQHLVLAAEDRHTG